MSVPCCVLKGAWNMLLSLLDGQTDKRQTGGQSMAWRDRQTNIQTQTGRHRQTCA